MRYSPLLPYLFSRSAAIKGSVWGFAWIVFFSFLSQSLSAGVNPLSAGNYSAASNLASVFVPKSEALSPFSVSQSAKPAEATNVPSKTEGFNATSMIMEHISDSHEWHLWGNLSLPLPVIMVTRKGIDLFSSARFEEGKGIVEGHQLYRLIDDKVRVVSASGQVIPAENTFFKVIDLSITKNVLSLFLSVAILLLVFIGIAASYKGDANKAPKGVQSVLEPFILFVRDDIAIPNLGKNYTRFMPFLLTLFFFIWLNNILGLIPFFPGGANLTGNISLTLTLALITFILTNFNGKKAYWGHIFTPGVPLPLYLIMVPVEIIGVFIKPLALTIRLFANITAGHVLVLSLIGLIFIFKNSFVAVAAIPFTVFISLIELLVGFLQAFIFTLLASLYIGTALVESEGHAHD